MVSGGTRDMCVRHFFTIATSQSGVVTEGPLHPPPISRESRLWLCSGARSTGTGHNPENHVS